MTRCVYQSRLEGDRFVGLLLDWFSNDSPQHIKHGQPFCIRDFLNPNRPRVYLPVKYMEEVKNATQDELSLPAILNNVGIIRYSLALLLTNLCL